MIAIDSTMVTSPSWIAGMKPAGLTARNSGSFSAASRSTCRSAVGKAHLLQQPDDPDRSRGLSAPNGNHAPALS